MDLENARPRARRRRVLTATVGSVLLLGGATAASAADSPSGATAAAPVIHTGCVVAGSGQLVGVTTSPAVPTTCASGDRRISWNMAGPRGAVGPQGPPGPGTVVPPTFTAGTVTVTPFSGAPFTFAAHQFSVAVTLNPAGGQNPTFTTVVAVQKALDATSPLLLRQASAARPSTVTLTARDPAGAALRTYVLPSVFPVLGGFDAGTGLEAVRFTNANAKPTVTQQQASSAPTGFAQRVTTTADTVGTPALAGVPAVILTSGVATAGPEVIVVPAANLSFLTALGAARPAFTAITVDFRTVATAPARNVTFGAPVVTGFTDTAADATPLLTTVTVGTYRTLTQTVGSTVVTCTIGSGAQQGCS